jgi:hypothetical protein
MIMLFHDVSWGYAMNYCSFNAGVVMINCQLDCHKNYISNDQKTDHYFDPWILEKDANTLLGALFLVAFPFMEWSPNIGRHATSGTSGKEEMNLAGFYDLDSVRRIPF